MQKVLKVHVSGQIVSEGFLLHGLFITADKSEPKIIFPINEHNGILAMDNEQNLYILCADYSLEYGKLSRINGDYVKYNFSGKIQTIGSSWFYYDNYTGKLQHVDSTWIYYDNYTGKLSHIGDVWFYYDNYSGKLNHIDNVWIYYDNYSGKLNRVGDIWIYYDDYSGKLKRIGDTWF